MNSSKKNETLTLHSHYFIFMDVKLNGMFVIIDIDECTDANPCDVNADCQNTPGAFICTCNSGFTGDGLTCAGKCAKDACIEAIVECAVYHRH